MTIGPILYTIQDAANLLNVKVSRLRTAVFRREIGYVKLAGLVRFTRSDLEDWIEKGQVPAKKQI